MKGKINAGFIELLSFQFKPKQTCSGYGFCQNKGLTILMDGKKKTYWCRPCLERAMKEGHVKLNIEIDVSKKGYANSGGND